MSDNIFFNIADLKKCGKNVIIGKTVRIRYPELVEIGDNVIIDDFCYISTALKIKSNVHISSGCKIIGGKKALVSFDRFSTLSPNVVIAAGSDDYLSGVATPMIPIEYKGNVEIGTVEINQHCIVGANSTILPNVVLETGSSAGANSLVNSNLKSWMLYAGIPAKIIKERDMKEILKLEKMYLESINE
jgi:acetyltransferase-like isoleucine patch superfamily enzyme